MSDDDEEEVLLVDGGSVKRPRCNKQERWDQLVSSGWVRTTESDRAVWFGKVDRGVWCIPCKQFLKLGTTFHNITKHFDLPSHKASAAALAAHQDIGVLLTSPAAQPVSSEEAKIDARATLALSAIRWAPKCNLSKLYGGPNISLAFKLAKHGPVLTEGGTTGRAVTRGYELLRDEIRALLKGKTVSLLIDEANSKLSSRMKPLALVVCSSLLPKPILVKLFWSLDDDDADDGAPAHPLLLLGAAMQGGGGAAAAAAAAAPPRKPSRVAADLIEAELTDLGVDLGSQVTCLCGDNASFIEAVANNLGVPRLRCLPHVLSLIFHALTKRLPLFTVATLSLSAVLRSGGGTRREEALRDAGIAPSNLHCVETRWNQLQDMSRLLIDRGQERPEPPGFKTLFERVREVIIGNPAFTPARPKGAAAAGAAAAAEAAAAAADPDEEADAQQVIRHNGAKVTVKTLLERVKAAFEVGVAAQDRKYYAEVECQIVEALAPNLPELIRVSSSDPANFPHDISKRLLSWRSSLEEAALPGFQSVPMETVYAASRYHFSLPERTALLNRYKDVILASATDAIAVYDKYVPEVLEKLKYRLRFEPMTEPDDYPGPPPGGQVDAVEATNFFGAGEGRLKGSVLLDWKTYCSKWKAGLPSKLKELSSAKFWANAEVKSWFRDDSQLCALGRWYAEMPLSNVATERVFSLMRASEGPLRHNMAEHSMDEELGAKVNAWIVDAMVERQDRLFK